jgi:hypothetical protein
MTLEDRMKAKIKERRHKAEPSAIERDPWNNQLALIFSDGIRIHFDAGNGKPVDCDVLLRRLLYGA